VTYEVDHRMNAAVALVQNALNSVIGSYASKLELEMTDLAEINVRVANILKKGTVFDRTFTWKIVHPFGDTMSVVAEVTYRDVIDRLGALDEA
jgi:hypothetical protein